MTAPQLVSYQMVLLRHTAAGRDFDEETRERIFREHLAYTLGLVGAAISSRRARSATARPRTRTSAGSASSRRNPWTRSAASSSGIRVSSRGCTAST
jgi:hypothetical protein